MKKTYSLLFGLLIAFGTGAQSANQIIPKPNYISYPHVPTPFLIQAYTLIYFDPAFANQATCDVIEDPKVEPGGCVVKTDLGLMDWQVSSQLSSLEEQLR